jgi:hypothetical protein
MQPLAVIELEVSIQAIYRLFNSAWFRYSLIYTSSYFTLRHSRSTKMLSNARPRPSTMAILCPSNFSLKAWPVNCALDQC